MAQGAHAGGASSEGIVLGSDGTLIAKLRCRDFHGVESTVVLRSRTGGPLEVVGPSQALPQGTAPAVTVVADSDERLEVISGLVREHLAAAPASDSLTMLRPALRLSVAREGDPVVAQLGGLPTLPINSWPVWEGHGPLSHVLSYDCEPVSALLPELGIPSQGRLAFFYFDGRFDNFASTVIASDPATAPGFRVLHLHPEDSTSADIKDAATPAPPGLEPFPLIPLAATKVWTWPSWETPLVAEVWRRHGLTDARPGVPHDLVGTLYDALWELPEAGHDAHQIGGHPCPQQGPVEMEAEELRRLVEGQPFDWDSPDVQASASELKLLLQVASDDAADMMWGDVGQLYYLAANAGSPTDAVFTWQCG